MNEALVEATYHVYPLKPNSGFASALTVEVRMDDEALCFIPQSYRFDRIAAAQMIAAALTGREEVDITVLRKFVRHDERPEAFSVSGAPIPPTHVSADGKGRSQRLGRYIERKEYDELLWPHLLKELAKQAEKQGTPRTLEEQLRSDLRIYGGRPELWEPLIAGAIDRTEPDETINLRGTGKEYAHSGMYAGASVDLIRARFTDGSERHLYRLTTADVGEDADVQIALYPSLDALREANRWLWEA